MESFPAGDLEWERGRRHSRGGSRSTWWYRRLCQDRYSSSGYRVTPAVTRSRAQPPGVSRTFTLLAAEADIARTLAQSDAALCDSEEFPAGPAHLSETPEMYEEAHAGPHDRIWAKAEGKELEGLSAVGTFVEEGGT